jgi:hypothetical protein
VPSAECRVASSELLNYSITQLQSYGLAVRCSLFAARCSLFAARYSLFATRCSLLATRYSLLAALSCRSSCRIDRGNGSKYNAQGNNDQDINCLNVYWQSRNEEALLHVKGDPVKLLLSETKRKTQQRANRYAYKTDS